MSGSTPTTIVKEKHLHSHDKIDYRGLTDEADLLKELARKLSVSGSYAVDNIEESIMGYGKLCQHDDAYLCECRLQFIIDFIRKNMFSLDQVKMYIAAFHLDSVNGNYSKELLEFKNNWIKENLKK